MQEELVISGEASWLARDGGDSPSTCHWILNRLSAKCDSVIISFERETTTDASVVKLSASLRNDDRGSSELLQLTINNIPLHIFWKDRDSRYLGCSRSVAEVAGYGGPDEMIGKTDYDMPWTAEQTNFYLECDERVMSSGTPEYNIIEPQTQVDGSKVWFNTNKVPLRDTSGKVIGILGTIEDITERIRVDEELRRLHKMADIINSMPSILIGVDLKGRITQWNAEAEKRTGVTATVAIGQTLNDAFPYLQADEENISQVIAAGKQYSDIRRLREENGELFYEDVSIYPLIAQEVQGVVIRIDDVSKENALQEQLNQSRKMEAIGQLAGGVAHDFNNLLTGIMGASELLRDEVLEDYSGSGLLYVDIISRAVDRAADLTSKLLAFGRKGRVSSVGVDVHLVLDDSIAILDKTIDKKIRIQERMQANNRVVLGDASSLQNAFLNMGINASHAMPEGGILSFESENVLLDDAFCTASPFQITPGQFLKIEVRDTGVGIPHESITKIFEPFFTTKAQGKGTGLGLAAVYGTVLDHHGAIGVHSEVGQGTSFHVYLPCSKQPVENETTSSSILKGTGTVPLVDDEEIVRLTAARSLEKMGYEVLNAENGLEGVELFKKHHARIDLVLLDMVMPVMNGHEAFIEMRKVDSKCKVVFSSGFTRDDNLKELRNRVCQASSRNPIRAPSSATEATRATGATGATESVNLGHLRRHGHGQQHRSSCPKCPRMGPRSTSCAGGSGGSKYTC